MAHHILMRQENQERESIVPKENNYGQEVDNCTEKWRGKKCKREHNTGANHPTPFIGKHEDGNDESSERNQ